MAEMTLIDAIREAMDEEMDRDERVFITGEDVGQRGGVFRATLGLHEKYGSDRVIDSPLAELSIVAVGIGGGSGNAPARVINQYFQNFGLQSLDTIESLGAFACYSCGFGSTCDVSMVQNFVDDSGQIDYSFKPDLFKGFYFLIFMVNSVV